MAFSLLLHGLLLWPSPVSMRESPVAQPFDVMLRAVPGAASSIPRAADREVAQPSARSKPQTLAVPAPAAIPSPLPVPAVPAPARAQEETARALNAPPSTTEMPGRSDGGPSLAAGSQDSVRGGNPRPGDGLDADGVRQYRMALAGEARRFRRYPARALAEGVGGTADVRISVASGGQVQEVALARSSGNEMLDEAALEMMRRAAPRTAVPDALRRRAFVITLPVLFNVSEQ